MANYRRRTGTDFFLNGRLRGMTARGYRGSGMNGI